MNRNTFGAILCALALSVITLVSCNKDEGTTPAVVPVLTLNSSVTVSPTGGSYTLSCTIAESKTDGELTATADVSWLSGFSVAASGTISFIAAENGREDLRTGSITVKYSYTEDSVLRNVIEKVAIIQEGNPSPSLSIDPHLITLDYEEESGSFSYSIANGVAGGDLNCYTDDEWIGSFDYSTYGTVGFTAAENETIEQRSGTITVAYTYAGYWIVDEIIIVQKHKGAVPDTGYEGDLAGLIGTYEAHGDALYSSNIAAEQTWTLKIYAYDDENVIIDGLTPKAAGFYPGSEAYIAKAYLDDDNQIIIPTQFTGYYNTSTGYYFGWTPCTKYTEGSGWSYNSSGPSCKLVYSSKKGYWTSDYGMILGLFTTPGDVSSINSLMDAANPGFTLTKTSDSTDD